MILNSDTVKDIWIQLLFPDLSITQTYETQSKKSLSLGSQKTLLIFDVKTTYRNYVFEELSKNPAYETDETDEQKVLNIRVRMKMDSEEITMPNINSPVSKPCLTLKLYEIYGVIQANDHTLRTNLEYHLNNTDTNAPIDKQLPARVTTSRRKPSRRHITTTTPPLTYTQNPVQWRV